VHVPDVAEAMPSATPGRLCSGSLSGSIEFRLFVGGAFLFFGYVREELAAENNIL